MTALAGALDFQLPAQLAAHDPPEADGRSRDEVRMLVAWSDDEAIVHARAADLPEMLAAGDLLVVNTSATLPAALIGVDADGRRLAVHVNGPAPPGSDRGAGDAWVVELRLPRGSSSLPYAGVEAGEEIDLPGGVRLRVLAPLVAGASRLRLARPRPGVELVSYLRAHGQPIRYGRVSQPWPIERYQTVYADEPGSAEMPSAGRPLSAGILARLVARGVAVAPIVLHAGVSSPEEGEPPLAERYRVPAATARLANAVRAGGGRLVAVGTTVVRALESTADDEGVLHAGAGWTDLVITSERGVRAVDGILTGWHEPRASHLALLEAVAGRPALERSYSAALAAGYRWHEFGDLHLVLPGRRRAR